MRFSIEQIFLTDDAGKLLGERAATAYHVVEAETLDGAVTSFLLAQDAKVMGAVQRFHGAQALATVQQGQKVFTIHVMPDGDAFRRESPRRAASERADAAAESSRERRP